MYQLLPSFTVHLHSALPQIIRTPERLCPSPLPTYILSWVSDFTLIPLEARVTFCALQEHKT